MSGDGGGGDGGGGEKEWSGNVFEDETWRPCLRNIHPAWLLAFRVVAFFVLCCSFTLGIVVYFFLFVVPLCIYLSC